MTDYVVDSSVVSKFFLPEPLSDKADLLLQGYLNGSGLFVAPEHLTAEVANVLWKNRRRGLLTLSQVGEHLADFFSLSIVLVPLARSLIEIAVEFAIQLDRTVYDALYLALSQQLNLPFVTADERLINATRPRFANAVWLGDLY
jgi:predicted nucleic acid-binding protein